MSLRTAVSIVALLAVPVPLFAQSQTSLRGRHRIELGIGFLGGISAGHNVTAGNVSTRSETNGVLGSIGYAYWVEERVALAVSASVLDADASVSVAGGESRIESATVTSLLFGLRYQPFSIGETETVRPYFNLAVGPYFGSTASVRGGMVNVTESMMETALGSRIGAGLDVLLGRRFNLGIGAGYHFVADFAERIGSEENYSGPELSMSFGLTLGG